MGNLFNRPAANPRAAPRNTRSPGPAAPPKQLVHVAPPHPLDPYTIATGLYDQKTCPWNANDVLKERMRRLIIEKKLAPRVTGLADAVEGASDECPVCFLYYAPYAINTLDCCKGLICTECYLSTQTPDGSKECPFCQRPGFKATYSGDPSVLLDPESKALHLRGTGASTGIATPLKPSTSGSASNPEENKRRLTESGIVFATIEDREAVHREIAAQDKLHAQEQAKLQSSRRYRVQSASNAFPNTRASTTANARRIPAVSSTASPRSSQNSSEEVDPTELLVSMLRSISEAGRRVPSNNRTSNLAVDADDMEDIFLRQAILASLATANEPSSDKKPEVSEPRGSVAVGAPTSVSNSGTSNTSSSPAMAASRSSTAPVVAQPPQVAMDEDEMLRLAMAMSLDPKQ